MDITTRNEITRLENENKILKNKLYEFMDLLSDDMNLVGNSGLPILKSQGFQKNIIEFKKWLSPEKEAEKEKKKI